MKGKQELAAVLQPVLDHESLQQYFHVEEVPGRKPLRIARNLFVEPEPELAKFGEPVLYEDKDALEENTDAYLEFQNLIINPDLAYVVFTYDVEGVRGKAFLVREEKMWRVENFEIVEY